MHEVDSHKTLIVPHIKLPHEILSAIFVCCISGTIQVPGDLAQAPWNLTHVCSTWRAVALNTPDLWNDVKVEISHTPSTPVDYRRMEIVNELFARAPHSPLSLTITFGNGPVIHWQLPDTISLLVIPHAARLRHLSAQSSQLFINKFLELHPGSVELLESVDLCDVDVAAYYTSNTNYITVFQNAPRLRKFSLWIPQGVNIHTLYLPWSQLTELNLGHLPIDSGSILEQCTSLLRCSLGYNTFLQSSDTSVPMFVTVVLPNVSSFLLDLTAVHAEQQVQDMLIRRFVLPRVTHFEVLSFNSMGNRWSPECTDFLARFTSLSKLRIDIPILQVEIERLLREIPSLTEFIAFQSSFSSNTLKSISSGALAPRLTKLACEVDVSMIDNILDMLKGRSKSMGAATGISAIACISGVSEESKIGWHRDLRFKQLVESGIEIYLGSPGGFYRYRYF